MDLIRLTETIAIIGLFLDAFGALIVLGPNLPWIAEWGTLIERKQLRQLIDELRETGHLDESAPRSELLGKLLREMSPAQYRFPIEEFEYRDGEVVYGAEGLNDGERTRVNDDLLDKWIDEYRGVDRDFYAVGAGLLFVGFLFQISAKMYAISVTLGWMSLLASIGVLIYMLYRLSGNIRYLAKQIYDKWIT